MREPTSPAAQPHAAIEPRRLAGAGESAAALRRNPVRFALGGAALCLLALAVTWALATHVSAIRWRDVVALQAFTNLGTPRIDSFANALLHLLNPFDYTVWALLLVTIALVRRRPRVALAVAIVLPSAPLAAEILKPLLAHAHDHLGWVWIGAASWPSGHATAAMTLVICALLVSPQSLRPTVAVLGSAFALAVGLSLLILAWHMPSDVIGGYLLATLFGALAVAALRAAEHRRPALDPRLGTLGRFSTDELIAPAALLFTAILAGVVLALLRAGEVAGYADTHHLVLAAAAAFAALLALITSSLTLALRG